MGGERGDMDSFVGAGGLFAVMGHRDAVHLVCLGLHALQHRGTLGVGLVASDGHLLRSRQGAGLVPEALASTRLSQLSGPLAAGLVHGCAEHTGPPESGALDAERMVVGRHRSGQMAVGVSGRFTNGVRLRRELTQAGAMFQTPSDAELLLHLVARSGQKTFVNRLVDALWKVEGAFSLVVLTEARLVAIRDPSGFRPLVLGSLGDAILVASEDAAIRYVGGEVHGAVGPGEIRILDPEGQQSVRPFPRAEPRACVHELVSLAGSDAVVFERSVHTVRIALGQRLASEHPCPGADAVVPVPGSERQATGYAAHSDLPVIQALIADPWVSGPEPLPEGLLELGAQGCWRVVPAAIEGRSLCVVAASSVTGRGLIQIVRTLRQAGAEQIHLRIASPLVHSSCAYGVSSPATDELLHVLHEGNLSEVLGARTVGVLSLSGLRGGVSDAGDPLGLCDACFSGELPLEPEPPDDQLPLF
ncbi:MAG TPA: hypothetical protein ENK18_22430 [Deltaproteobacteria bacterium]|nr:hypothetical protein [Deltaproteobacteria bacterium]